MTLDHETESHILQLQAAAQQNRLVIFVGAGVSASAGVPIWRDLVDVLENKLPESMRDSDDMLKIAQMYRELRGDVEYQETIKKTLKAGEVGHTQIHDMIMKLNPCHIVTTNYDDLLEQAALSNNKQYYVVAKDEQLPANQGEKMLIKMHGDFTNGNIVLTENDYYDYSRNFPLIRSFLLSLFSTKVVLFVGFSFNDINLKYILREVSCVLNEKMRRVYLLVNDHKTPLEYSYFQKKGVQLLCLPSNLTSNLLCEDVSEHGFSDDKSIALFQSLALLCYYDQFDNNLMSRTLDFLDKYEGQLRFWGKYLDRAFPKKKSLGFDIKHNNLSVPNYYRAWFMSIIESENSKKLFIDMHKDDLERLFDMLIDNEVTTVNAQPITNVASLLRNRRKYNNNTINLIYRLDFEGVEKRLRELRIRPANQTIDDLELPYLLFKLGKYYEAYVEYGDLASEMWRHHKYILYFISLFNLKSLEKFVISEISRRRDVDVIDIKNAIDAINLDEILSNLPIENRVKRVFEELLNGQMLMRKRIESANLNEELSAQREKAQKGGLTINDRIIVLLDTFNQLFMFSNKNYILTECHPDSAIAYKSMAEGIINSIMTPDSYGIQTKLNKLVKSNIWLFVFMIKPGNLAKVLKKANTPIPADKRFVKELNVLVENMAKESKNSFALMDPTLLSDYLKNIIMLLNTIESPTYTPNIYVSIVNYWHVGRFVEFVPEFRKLVNRQKPTAKEAVKLIDCVLHSKTIMIGRNVVEFVASLASIAKKGGEVLDDFVSIEQVTGLNYILLESAFLWSVPQKYRQELINHLREHVDDIYDLCLMETYTKAHIITPDLFLKLCNSVSREGQDNPRREAMICYILIKMTEKKGYSELNGVFEDFKTGNKCCQFLSAPLKYNNMTEVKKEWLECVNEKDLSVLLKQKEIKLIVAKGFRGNSQYSPEFKKKIIRLMFEEGPIDTLTGS